MSQDEGEKFRFRREMKIGTPAAETDNLLKKAFYDTGKLNLLLEANEPESIVVGRTGSGKSALLLELERQKPKNVIRINPKATSLQFLSNSTILPQLQEIGVNLSLFYHKLWQHVIILELLRDHYDIKSKEKQQSWLQSLMAKWGATDQSKVDALRYIGQWDDQFFAKPEDRVKRVTQSLEDKIDASVGGKLGQFIDGSVSGALGEKREVVEEVREKSQQIVQQIQIKRLEDMKRLVREDILDDVQSPYYVLIDDLDKYWIERDFAYDLIKTLLDVAGDFAKMDNIKLVLALRTNIVQRIHEEHRDPGRQRIKDNALFVSVDWEYSELEDMMDKRVRVLVRGYYGGELGLGDILPSKEIQGTRAVDYILERTLRRPRDFIVYMNYCIREGVNRNNITWSIIKVVEGEYSRNRVKALEDEWEENYPGLHELINVFTGMEDGFRIDEVDQVKLGSAAERWKEDAKGSYLGKLGHVIGASQAGTLEIIGSAVQVLYKVGIVGVKLTTGDDVEYVYDSPSLLEFGLQEESIIYFHPATYKALGVVNGKRALESRR